MKKCFKWPLFSIGFLFVIFICLAFFLQKPPLLKQTSFSQAIYDENHHLLRLTLSQDEKYRLFVPLSSIAVYVKNTTLLQEDQYFHWHFGVNPFSLFKAIWQTYLKKNRRVGASTLTMQLARIRFHIHSKTIFGKMHQILRAIQLEIHYTKEELLEAYLNLAPYGNNIEGVGAASLIYFGKRVNELNLPEALTLAVIPQNPLSRTPKQKTLKISRDKLFQRWVKVHLEDRRFQFVLNSPMQIQGIKDLPFLAPHFVNTLLKKLPSSSQETVTTLNIALQTLLERIIKHYVAQKKPFGVNNAAALLMDARDMSVKAWVGSAQFFDPAIAGQIDGTTIKRSPGSTLKPFIYGLAFDQGLIHPLTLLKDVPKSFGGYNPENFDYDFMGPLHAKDALTLSRNIPAIYLAEQLKPTLYDLLRKAQVTKLKPASYYGLSLALGGAEITLQELVSLYAMLYNQGIWQPLNFQKRSFISFNTRLLSAEASFLLLDILKHTPRPQESEHIAKNEVAWKTGTSSGYRDAWTVGVYGPYVLAVWLGNFNNVPNHAFVGKNLAAPLFFELIEGLKRELSPISFQENPSSTLNLIQVKVCKASGFLPTRYCPATLLTWFIPGKSPIKTDTIYREIPINRKTGLRACQFNQETQFKVYEFWSSDLLKIFKDAGIQRRLPPPFDSQCTSFQEAGLAPQITSPEVQLNYIIRANSSTKTLIPLSVVTDADVREVHWFLNDIYLGKVSPSKPFFWQAKAGHFIVRVVDDQGRGDARDIFVKMET